MGKTREQMEGALTSYQTDNGTRLEMQRRTGECLPTIRSSKHGVSEINLTSLQKLSDAGLERLAQLPRSLEEPRRLHGGSSRSAHQASASSSGLPSSKSRWSKIQTRRLFVVRCCDLGVVLGV